MEIPWAGRDPGGGSLRTPSSRAQSYDLALPSRWLFPDFILMLLLLVCSNSAISAVLLHHLRRLVLLQRSSFFPTLTPCSELRAIFALGPDLHVKILEHLAGFLINVYPFEHLSAKIFAFKWGHGKTCLALIRQFWAASWIRFIGLHKKMLRLRSIVLKIHGWWRC